MALPAALPASGTVSPSIGTAWDGLAPAEVRFPSAAVVSVFQLFTSCTHELSSSSSSQLQVSVVNHCLGASCSLPLQGKPCVKSEPYPTFFLRPGGGKASGDRCLRSPRCRWSLSEPRARQSPLSGVPNTRISQRCRTDVLAIQTYSRKPLTIKAGLLTTFTNTRPTEGFLFSPCAYLKRLIIC